MFPLRGPSAVDSLRLAYVSGRLPFLGVVVTSVVSGAISAPAAWLTGRIVNDLTIPSTSTYRLVVETIAATLLVGGSTAISYGQGIFGSRLSANVRVATQVRLASACSQPRGTEYFDDGKRQDALRIAQHVGNARK